MDLEEIKKEAPQKGLEGFVSEFLEDRLDELVALEESLQEADFTSIKACGHKWKGFSAPYGFNYLETLSKELEQGAIESNFEVCKKCIEKVKNYLEVKKGLVA